MATKLYRTHIQGESLLKKVDDLKFDFLELFLRALLLLILATWTLAIYLGWIKVNLVQVVVMYAAVVFFTLQGWFKGRKILRKLRNYKKGLEGERFVGNVLNQLQSDKTYVFHDVVSDGFNIDHLIVSTRGIFTIETKHYDRAKGHKFLFQGGKLTFNGRLCGSLLAQMNGQANYIRERVVELTGSKVTVRKAAIIIGSYIENPDKDFSEYWILNEKGFCTFFENSDEILEPLLVRSIADQLRKSLQVAID